MFDKLIDEIAKLHHQIHESEPIPANERERQALGLSAKRIETRISSMALSAFYWS